jgi:hypothetical protein
MRVARHRSQHRVLNLVLFLALATTTAGAADAPAHLVPHALSDGLVLNVPQRMIFVMQAGQAIASYPVGLGRPSWPTFVGPFTIAVKEIDPVWDVPISIQEELRSAGQPVVTRVGPGPANPLGKYWLGLSVAGYGIHGTNAPRSISRFESHGCVRLVAADIEDLFMRVDVGMAGVSIYEPVVLEVIDGALWLEAHPDVYRRHAAVTLDDIVTRAAALTPGLAIDAPAVTEARRRHGGPSTQRAALARALN